jgi:hypothetical protein
MIQLAQKALEIANSATERARSLEVERLQLETRLRAIQATIDSTKLCRERAREFRPEIDGNFQCPRCWVLHETEVSLVPIPSVSNDLFRCARCGEYWVLESTPMT